MDAVEILGSLLGGKAGGSGAGANVLKDLLGGVLGGKTAASQGQPRQAGAGRAGGSNSLEDLLGGALKKFQQRQGGADCNDPTHRGSASSGASELDNAQAVVLIRAMINAAKSDGKLDRQEQEAIVQRLGNVTQEEMQFLKSEFAAPLDVREFAWSVPLGMEHQAYTMSLMAIDLDQNKEASYLRDLAHGLRIAPDTCNQIHQQYRAPMLYKT